MNYNNYTQEDYIFEVLQGKHQYEVPDFSNKGSGCASFTKKTRTYKEVTSMNKFIKNIRSKIDPKFLKESK